MSDTDWFYQQPKEPTFVQNTECQCIKTCMAQLKTILYKNYTLNSTREEEYVMIHGKHDDAVESISSNEVVVLFWSNK